jgi:hypothetical protein
MAVQTARAATPDPAAERQEATLRDIPQLPFQGVVGFNIRARRDAPSSAAFGSLKSVEAPTPQLKSRSLFEAST